MPNRLIGEKSPYLLQHANNPVDWYPWGEEAFQRARLEGKPVFLSIGYSTCHWCHVMARECFEDQEVADYLNKHFVSIKVDREERPDIDDIYMAFCQALTGSGGWPLSVFLTPEGKPFFAGTYFPKKRMGKVPGFLEVLEQIKRVWEERKADVEANARTIVEILNRRAVLEEDQSPDPERLFHEAFEDLSGSFDSQWGGFGHAPKFPTPHQLMFLLRYYAKYGKDMALHMVEQTLKMIVTGGIYDQLGGGIHRYAVDREWMIPHFEKMLYDQAMIAMALAEAYGITGNELFARAAKGVSDYVLRDLADPDKRFFFSAEDAESNGEEGAYYLWSFSEIIDLLGEEDGLLASRYFGVTKGGNFEGRNVLSRRFELNHGLKGFTREKIEELSSRLLNKRAERPRPFRDEKIIASWNGLEISALSTTGLALGEKRYIDAALNVARSIKEAMIDDCGDLAHTLFQGELGPSGFLEDYAFFAMGCLDLYRACGDPEVLLTAVEVSRTMVRKFWNEEEGFFRYTSGNDPFVELIPAGFYDAAMPSAFSVAFSVASRLFRITGDPFWKDLSDRMLKKLPSLARRAPMGATFFLTALCELYLPKEDLVFLPGEDMGTEEFLMTLGRQFAPGRLVVCLPEDFRHRDDINKLVPYTRDMTNISRYATVYPCVNGVCGMPLRAREYLSTNR